MTGAAGPQQGSTLVVRSSRMGQGISEVLPFAIGIAISPIPIIAIILILFSNRATVNGLAFLFGWMAGLAVVGTAVYLFADAANAATDSTSSDTISWGKILLGVFLLSLARRNFAKRPTPGQPEELPKWMATVETITPVKAVGLAIVLAVVNPKNLILAVGACAGLGQLGLEHRGRGSGDHRVRGGVEPVDPLRGGLRAHRGRTGAAPR